MQINSVWKRDDTVLRILAERGNDVLVIDCKRMTMPTWIGSDALGEYEPCDACELRQWNPLFRDESTLKPKEISVMRQRFTAIAGILPILTDDRERSRRIAQAAEQMGVSRHTVRNYLCLYLAYQDMTALAPKRRNSEAGLSMTARNIRWALNKFYYTRHRNSLKTAYVRMLKEKYCDKDGNLLQDYPSIHQFRYYYRTHRNMQDYYISREGMCQYQRNHRPLLGDGVQEFAPNVGVGMMDATVCDIYLVNETGGLVGRPILTACIDAYSGLCCGYTLSWEGGTYSLRGLVLSVIEDKVDFCLKHGIVIDRRDWDCADVLPGTLVTDMETAFGSSMPVLIRS